GFASPVSSHCRYSTGPPPHWHPAQNQVRASGSTVNEEPLLLSCLGQPPRHLLGDFWKRCSAAVNTSSAARREKTSECSHSVRSGPSSACRATWSVTLLIAALRSHALPSLSR